MPERNLGIDVGAETIKIAEIFSSAPEGPFEVGRTWMAEHQKDPANSLRLALLELDFRSVASVAITGRLSRLFNLEKVPVKAAQVAGLHLLFPDLATVTLVSIGSHGFSVLELRQNGSSVLRENSRCSQGTGNFLRQLVERFDLSVEEASELCAQVNDPAPLSGRCPVILKTDMTHLANKGESHARILAGLYDAVCENVQVLIKPKLAPAQVLLAGGVSRAHRIRAHFSEFLEKNGMSLVESDPEELLFIEAVGAGVEAARRQLERPGLDALIRTDAQISFEEVPALGSSRPGVERLEHQISGLDTPRRDLILGLDIGSTGSKAIALDTQSREPIWESYGNTSGDPVGAARALVQSFVDEGGDKHRLLAVGATGSGREIVGSLLTTCFGPQRVFVLNEIAAHAEGARYYDAEVDTIFEIGGQDAKYIRLADGQVCDAAMNEACSAGTGSFIEEQGQKFAEVDNVVQMGELAIEADHGISLGQHCSVFMAEIIDGAVAASKDQKAILAGIYDSIIQNYLNRVKGSRSVGQKIFCQGMPFSADALAAAVVRLTGREVVVPPSPGTVGALGIALLAAKELSFAAELESLELPAFLQAQLIRRDTFACRSKKGCGEPGNNCRIDRLTTMVANEKRKFLWGGSCSLYDQGAGRGKLPDLAPDPFRERQELIQAIVEDCARENRERPTVAITDEFVLKGLFPFFAAFLDELGFCLQVRTHGDQAALKRGIAESNVPYCAPLQLYNGLVAEMLAAKPDILLLPMLRDLPRVRDEETSTTCPLSQASGDLLRENLGNTGSTRLLQPVIDMAQGNLDSDLFQKSCRKLAAELGVASDRWQAAYRRGSTVQQSFQEACLDIGRRALDFCAAHDVVPVVVLGRAYTIYNDVLNSNVPSLLRQQGAIALPVDCYPVADEVPVFETIYWGYSQVSLRAAHQIRRRPGVYSVFCSNYSCGPDSFNLHFYAHIMQGKPFAIIETDGHSGDAGTKTRVEAFLYCVESDRRADHASATRPKTIFRDVELDRSTFLDIRKRGELLLAPRMGPGAEIATAALRGEGMRAQSLGIPDRDALRLGRQYTSGKECVPMTVTLGSLLARVLESDEDERFAFFMPTASGPCRFGAYNLLHKVVLENLGLRHRVRLVVQPDHDYFQGLSKGFAIRMWTAFVATDLLLDMLHDVRPVEREPGAANEIYGRYHRALESNLESSAAPKVGPALGEVTGDLFGIESLLASAAAEFAAIKDLDRQVPTVAVVGEIYVRCDPFANDFVIERLEERGLRVKFAPFGEWIEYSEWLNYKKKKEGRHHTPGHWLSQRVNTAVQYTVVERLYRVAQRALGWGPRTKVTSAVESAERYLTSDLHGEAVLTLGGPIHEYEAGEIVGVVNVGPLECMPTKIAEAQFFHVAEQSGLVALTLALNGDPVDLEALDNFAYEIHTRFAARPPAHANGHRKMTAMFAAWLDDQLLGRMPKLPLYTLPLGGKRGARPS